MKVAELEGALLDAAVAKAEGRPFFMDKSVDEEYVTRTDWCMAARAPEGENQSRRRADHKEFTPSDDWADGGPIIERERIGVVCVGFPPLHWQANVRGSGVLIYGDTPLIAAMRAYVASKFGEEVDL